MWTQVSSSLSGAQGSSTERAYIALPQRLSICEQKLLSHLTFSMSAEVSIEQLLRSFYRNPIEAFIGVLFLDGPCPNQLSTQSLEKSRWIYSWDTKQGCEAPAQRYLWYCAAMRDCVELCSKTEISATHRARESKQLWRDWTLPLRWDVLLPNITYNKKLLLQGIPECFHCKYFYKTMITAQSEGLTHALPQKGIGEEWLKEITRWVSLMTWAHWAECTPSAVSLPAQSWLQLHTHVTDAMQKGKIILFIRRQASVRCQTCPFHSLSHPTLKT